MATSYEEFSQKERSEKVVLCHIEPVQRLLIWTLDSGSQYKRSVDHFTIGVVDNVTAYTEGTLPLNSGEWFYDAVSGELYVRASDDSNPNTRDLHATYRLFFSNSPLHLPYDLSSGEEVEYQGLLKSNSAIKKELDSDQIGIALESSTNIELHNGDGSFDEYYDTLFFENKRVRLWSWSPDIPLSEKRLLFDGQIQDKTFDPQRVRLSCKDFMFKLREKLSLPLFSSGDGNLSDSILNTPKRRIYGQVDNVRCVAIDNVLNGFSLTGTISGNFEGNTLTGIGTSFLDEVSPADTLTITIQTETLEISVESVESDTSLTIGEELEFGFSGQTAINSPSRPWRKRNRNWHIAGHKLREPTTTIVSGTQPNRFTVADGSDMFNGDLIDIDGFDVNIKRIVGNDIVLRQNLPSGTPSGGEVVTKNSVSRAFAGTKEAFINRDWTISNTTEAILNFNNLAEFNIAPQKSLSGSFTFTNGLRTVVISGIDALNQVQTRDWIRSDDITHTTWYEILEVEESQITLRTAYAGTNTTGGADKKNVELIEDNTLVTLNCIGLESSGEWVKTASDAVKHLIENDSGITAIDTASFTEADADAPYILSMVIPETIGGSIPTVRDTITKINESVFGSLVNDTDFNLVYNVLTPEKPETLEEIKQHDIIGEPMVRSRNEIVRKVNLSYAPFTDRFKSEDSFKLIEFTNDFVDKYIGAKQELDITVFLYEDNDAQAIAERYAFYNSLSQSTVTVKSKLNLSILNLNDKLFVNLDRIYKRFGGKDRRKIGIVSKITKDGSNTSVEFNDLGNIFNRCMSIAPDTANEFTSATESEKIKNGYILDDDLEVPDITSDNEIGQFLIG